MGVNPEYIEYEGCMVLLEELLAEYSRMKKFGAFTDEQKSELKRIS